MPQVNLWIAGVKVKGNFMTCHHLVVAYLAAKKVVPSMKRIEEEAAHRGMGWDRVLKWGLRRKISQPARAGGKLHTSPGDVICFVSGNGLILSHSMIAYSRDAWVGVNNLGTFGNVAGVGLSRATNMNNKRSAGEGPNHPGWAGEEHNLWRLDNGTVVRVLRYPV
jgi:hypothetical protein